MIRMRLAVAIGAVALCALPASAAAHPHKGKLHHAQVAKGLRTKAHRTPNGVDIAGQLPVAAKLCARAGAGNLPKPLAGSESAVESACASLKSALTQATTTFQNAVAPLKQQASDALTAARAACAQARTSGDPTGCEQALAQLRSTLQGLRGQLRSAVEAYGTAVNDARTAFWSAIRSLAGGTAVKPDRSTSKTPPLPTLPGAGLV